MRLSHSAGPNYLTYFKTHYSPSIRKYSTWYQSHLMWWLLLVTCSNSSARRPGSLRHQDPSLPRANPYHSHLLSTPIFLPHVPMGPRHNALSLPWYCKNFRLLSWGWYYKKFLPVSVKVSEEDRAAESDQHKNIQTGIICSCQIVWSEVM